MLIVGLGNPGARYDGTRHNVGFELVDRLVARWGARPALSDRSHVLYEATVGGRDVSLMKPLTYMNRSGIAIARYGASHALSPAECLAVVDDMFLETGRLRFRRKGSDGGHNGLMSLEHALGTSAYPRLRIGVGPAPESSVWADFVLAPFTADERARVEDAMPRAEAGVEVFLEHGIDRAMRETNG